MRASLINVVVTSVNIIPVSIIPIGRIIVAIVVSVDDIIGVFITGSIVVAFVVPIVRIVLSSTLALPLGGSRCI